MGIFSQDKYWIWAYSPMCFCNTPWPEVEAQHPGFNSHNSIRNPILIVQNLDTNCHVSTRIFPLLLLGLQKSGFWLNYDY
jgi:hypothetical protein